MDMTFSHDHVGLSITPADLDATLEWYTSTLDFVVDQQFESHGTTFTFLVNGTVRVEVMTGASRRQPPTDDVFSSMDPARLHHVCLVVDDLDATLTELAQRGVEPIGGPMEIAAIDRRIAFVSDNLGNVIELSAVL